MTSRGLCSKRTWRIAAGSSTEDDPYLIPDRDTLEYYRDLINDDSTGDGYRSAHYRLTDDIDLGGDTNQWTPIGSDYYQAFTGTFDGGNHTISGLYIDSSSEYAGLFGYVGKNGVVEDLTVSGEVTGSGDYTGSVYYTGGIVGRNDGTVSNCTNNVNVTGNGDYTGGVVGRNDCGTVVNSYNTGTVNGSNNTGGVVGDNFSGTVSNCYNTGAVRDGLFTGGVVGGNSSTVSNCYNRGEVSGDNNVGGIVGCNSYSGDVTNCYNTGTVTATGANTDYIGGVVDATFTTESPTAITSTPALVRASEASATLQR